MNDAEQLQVWIATYEPSVIVVVDQQRIVMRPARPLIGTFEVETPRSDDLYMDLDTTLRQLVSSTG